MGIAWDDYRMDACEKSTIAPLSGRIMIPVYNTRSRAMGRFLLTVLFFYSSYNNINYQDVACCQAANRQNKA